MQIALTGFLGKSAAKLMNELWILLLDAQDNGGIPLALEQSKKDSIIRRKVILIFSCFFQIQI